MLTQSAQTLEKTEVKLNEKDKLISELQAKIAAKDEELAKTEEMFKEYAVWRSKLEQIETRMKDEAQHWKSAAERLQKENTSLQKEALKMTQEIMERVKLIKSKDDTI